MHPYSGAAGRPLDSQLDGNYPSGAASRPTYWFALYITSFSFTTSAVLLPVHYSTWIPLVFFLVPMINEAMAISTTKLPADANFAETPGQITERQRHNLYVSVFTLTSLACLCSFNFFNIAQSRNVLLIVACPLWHILLWRYHYGALLPVQRAHDVYQRENTRLNVELEHVRQLSAQCKEMSERCSRRMHRAIAEGIEARKSRRAISIHVDDLLTQTSVLKNDIVELELEKVSTLDNFDSLRSTTREWERECDELRLINQKIQNEYLDVKRRMDFYYPKIECAQYKLRTFGDAMDESLETKLEETAEASSLRSSTNDSLFRDDRDKSSFTSCGSSFTGIDFKEDEEGKDDSGIMIVRPSAIPPPDSTSTPRKLTRVQAMKAQIELIGKGICRS